MKIIIYGDELYHYGIKGQKWGDRNYQEEDGSYTPEGQRFNNNHGRYYEPKNKKIRNKKNSIKKENNRNKDNRNKDNKIKENRNKENSISNIDDRFHLTEAQKKILIGAGVVVGVGITAYGAYKIYGKLNDDGSIKMLAHPETWEESLKKSNPFNLGTHMPGTNYKLHANIPLLQGADENCVIDGVIVDFRQRGYDVTAGLYDGGLSLNNVNELFYNGKGVVSKALKITDLQARLDKMPVGARGLISFNYKGGGGHGIPWTVESTGIKIGDGEHNVIYGNTINDLRKAYTLLGGSGVKDSMVSTSQTARILRLDNIKEVNEKVFSKDYQKTSDAAKRIAKGFMKDVDLRSSDNLKAMTKETKKMLSNSNGKSFVNTTNNLKTFVDNIKISDGKSAVKSAVDYIPEKVYYAKDYGHQIVDSLLGR